jgi:hypothetical protein
MYDAARLDTDPSSEKLCMFFTRILSRDKSEFRIPSLYPVMAKRLVGVATIKFP